MNAKQNTSNDAEALSCVLVSPREIFARVSEPKEGGEKKEERRERRVGVKFSLNEKKCDTRGGES